MVTYPKSSRFWMRRTGEFLKENKISAMTPHLRRRCFALMRTLSPSDPRRLTFESQPETRTASGIVDAFLHVQENPLAPLQWARACLDAGLELFAETQNETSRSSFLDEIVPELKNMNPWIKLQILDDLLELCSNPVLWLHKPRESMVQPLELPEIPKDFDETPLEPRLVFKKYLQRISVLLDGTGVMAQTLFERFKIEVGPRVSPDNPEVTLPGLALTDYSYTELTNS